MCNPALITGISMGAQALGSFQRSRQQARQAEADNLARRNQLRAIEDERARQAEFDARAQQETSQAAEQVGAESQQGRLEDAFREREARINEFVGSAAEQAPVPLGATNQVITDAFQNRLSDVLKSGRERVKSRAKVGARGDVQFTDQGTIRRAARNIGDINLDAAGSLSGAQPGIDFAGIAPNVPQGSLADVLQGGGGLATQLALPSAISQFS